MSSEGIRDQGWSLKCGLDSREGRGRKALLTGRGCRQRRIELGGSGGGWRRAEALRAPLSLFHDTRHGIKIVRSTRAGSVTHPALYGDSSSRGYFGRTFGDSIWMIL